MTTKPNLVEWMDSVERDTSVSDSMLEVKRLKASLRAERSKNDELLHRVGDYEAREALWIGLQEHETAPIAIQGHNFHRREATLVALASDWHVEEVVKPETINGLNAYNPEIAEIRSEIYFSKLLWELRNARTGQSQDYGFDIHNIVLWLGGDLISGYIHEELLESNAMSPIQATLLAERLISSGIQTILEQEPDLHQLTIVCSYGNHGRTTQKRRHSTAAANSFEWNMYKHLEKLFANEPRVKFIIADGSHTYLQVYDWTIRFHHGDDVKYGGGVGGLAVPLRKAIDSWNVSKHADITCIGHYHQLLDESFAVVNGSLIGYNAYAQSIKARFEPPRQGLFLICRDEGKRGVIPINVGGEFQ